jgi:hypothetical protein
MRRGGGRGTRGEEGNKGGGGKQGGRRETRGEEGGKKGGEKREEGGRSRV